jgi:hypothetical protein
MGHLDRDAEDVGLYLGPGVALSAAADRTHRPQLSHDAFQALEVVLQTQGGPLVDGQRQVTRIDAEVETDDGATSGNVPRGRPFSREGRYQQQAAGSVG